MALTSLPRAFEVIMKTLEIFEINYLGAEMTNINVWVPFSNSLQTTLKSLKKFEICVLGAKDTNIIIWVILEIAQNVCYFSRFFL